MTDENAKFEDSAAIFCEAECPNMEPLHGPTFMLDATIAKDGSVRYVVSDWRHTKLIEVSREVWRDLLDLQTAGEIRGLRTLLEDVFDSRDEDGIVASLRRLAP